MKEEFQNSEVLVRGKEVSLEWMSIKRVGMLQLEWMKREFFMDVYPPSIMLCGGS